MIEIYAHIMMLQLVIQEYLFIKINLASHEVASLGYFSHVLGNHNAWDKTKEECYDYTHTHSQS